MSLTIKPILYLVVLKVLSIWDTSVSEGLNWILYFMENGIYSSLFDIVMSLTPPSLDLIFLLNLSFILVNLFKESYLPVNILS